MANYLKMAKINAILMLKEHGWSQKAYRQRTWHSSLSRRATIESESILVKIVVQVLAADSSLMSTK